MAYAATGADVGHDLGTASGQSYRTVHRAALAAGHADGALMREAVDGRYAGHTDARHRRLGSPTQNCWRARGDARGICAHQAGLLGRVDERRSGCIAQTLWCKPDRLMRTGPYAVATAGTACEKLRLADGSGWAENGKDRSSGRYRLCLALPQETAGDQGATAERPSIARLRLREPAHKGCDPAHNATFGWKLARTAAACSRLATRMPAAPSIGQTNSQVPQPMHASVSTPGMGNA
jgi:hypothetical protein